MTSLLTASTARPDDRGMTDDEFNAAVESANLGTATARKQGRNPRFPYVPVILITDDVGVTRQSQIKGLAYATREEAVDAAERHIWNVRAKLAIDLADPTKRALREQHGLPRELDS